MKGLKRKMNILLSIQLNLLLYIKNTPHKRQDDNKFSTILTEYRILSIINDRIAARDPVTNVLLMPSIKLQITLAILGANISGEFSHDVRKVDKYEEICALAENA